MQFERLLSPKADAQRLTREDLLSTRSGNYTFLRLGLILACTPKPHLFQRNPNKIDGGVTRVAGVVFFTELDCIHPTDLAVFSDNS